ncbi:MAG TPA: PEP-utilizing enzyme [Candidatus Nanoarchaeia archaeon]|nr:PEP-utilizing enzyme [Candidatus Nanoarchaeia archaeon]
MPSFNVKELKKIDWKLMANRREALLFRSITDNAYAQFETLTGIPWRANSVLWFSDGDMIFSEAEVEKLRSVFVKGGITLLSSFRDKLIRAVQAFDDFSHSLEGIDYSRKTKAELLSLTETYFTMALSSHAFLFPVFVSDGVISRLILDLLPGSDDEKQSRLSVLVYPEKENIHVQEELDFYRIVGAKGNRDRLIASHLQKYAWIGARWYFFENFWRTEDVLGRVQSGCHKDPRKEIEALNMLRRQILTSAKDLEKRLEIAPGSLLSKYICLAREFAYLRTWRTDVVYRAGYLARGLFYEISKRAGLKKEDVIYLTFSEAVDTAKTGRMPVSLQTIHKRKKAFATMLFNGDYIVLVDEKQIEALRSLVKQVPVSDSVKGSVAFSGKASGKVKIVFTTEDLKHFRLGDILIAVMTFPHFISAMEKAAAIVTDEGGITCHATIVAREFKIPTIIGTKIATKVFKDGDLVEVDADKGVARILR